MPIIETRGNLLDDPAQAHVNTVNTVGVMGGGIALAFKKRYPDMFAAYAADCARGEVVTGLMHLWHNPGPGPRLVVNFPTKQDWRNDSELAWVVEGLTNLIDVLRAEGVTSIAIPPLGCGLGGLDWAEVRPLIERAFNDRAPDIEVHLYLPRT